MISESSEWKRELRGERARFQRFQKTIAEKAAEETDFDLLDLRTERFFFISAFIIRKLLEAGKLSDEMAATTIPVMSYPRIDPSRLLDFMNCHHIERFYDLGAGQQRNLSLRDLCNTFIHSFVFVRRVEHEASGLLAGVFVNSDRIKNSALCYVALADFFEIVRLVIGDAIVAWSYDRRTGKRTASSRPRSYLERGQ